MSRRDFLPDADGPFAAWCRNFIAAVAADPTRYGLTLSDAAELEAVLAAFEAAFATALDPATRTSVAVCIKNQARAALERLLRSAAHRVQSFPGTGAGDRTALGLSDRTPRGSRIGPPQTQPVLSRTLTPRGSIPALRIQDSLDFYRTALPHGVSSALVFTCVCPPGTSPPTDFDGWRFEGIATRDLFPLPDRPEDEGLRVYAMAVWANPRGQLGPRSTPLLLSPGITRAAA